jgi:hypothetical protein
MPIYDKSTLIKTHKKEVKSPLFSFSQEPWLFEKEIIVLCISRYTAYISDYRCCNNGKSKTSKNNRTKLREMMIRDGISIELFVMLFLYNEM